MILRVATRLVSPALALFTAVALSPQGATRAKTSDDPEAYAVYAKVLSIDELIHANSTTTLVIQEETGTNMNCLPSGKPLDADWRPIVDSFRSANAGPSRVQLGFELGAPYVVAASAEIHASLHTVPHDLLFGWTGFYKRFPGSSGFIIMSAVGFDAEQKRAMVYLSHLCGVTCGSGRYHLLERVDGAWRAAKLPGVSYCMSAS